ncbi:hypothetical protein [Zhihengliuella halotolerans]|uniref:hypothetical protein n=1 Tax=Zhihengliuella halotolerans TaxID=370736 RepID=UPI000C80AF8E|nr:hypothetical protein [Zhihengliuella halotolerans]
MTTPLAQDAEFIEQLAAVALDALGTQVPLSTAIRRLEAAAATRTRLQLLQDAADLVGGEQPEP